MSLAQQNIFQDTNQLSYFIQDNITPVNFQHPEEGKVYKPSTLKINLFFFILINISIFMYINITKELYIMLSFFLFSLGILFMSNTTRFSFYILNKISNTIFLKCSQKQLNIFENPKSKAINFLDKFDNFIINNKTIIFMFMTNNDKNNTYDDIIKFIIMINKISNNKMSYFISLFSFFMISNILISASIFVATINIIENYKLISLPLDIKVLKVLLIVFESFFLFYTIRKFLSTYISILSKYIEAKIEEGFITTRLIGKNNELYFFDTYCLLYEKVLGANELKYISIVEKYNEMRETIHKDKEFETVAANIVQMSVPIIFLAYTTIIVSLI